MRILLMFCLSLLSSIIVAQEQFILNGSFTSDEYNGKTVLLKELDESLQLVTVDSCIVSDQAFVFKGTVVDMPKVVMVGINNTPAQFLAVLESGSVQLVIETSSNQVNVEMKGAPHSDAFQVFQNEQKAVFEKIRAAGSSQGSDSEREQLLDELKSFTFTYIEKNKRNGIGEFVILDASRILEKEKIKSLLDGMRPSFLKSKFGTQLSAYAFAKTTSVGDEYSDIKLKDQHGKDILLSDYVGKHKLVLIDFWASWCGPCRKEMPTVVEAYAKYKSKGFEIVGISLDEKQGAWEQSIKSMDMTWPQMSDLGGWKSAAAKLYNVTSIPLTLLIDQKGKIIAKNLRGEQLISKLDELLK